MPSIRYDSPTWGGFRFETSWGKNTLTPFASTTESNFWDVAVFYTGDWNSIKLSAAAAYTWQETGALTGSEVDLFQVGGSIMHKPSGLGVYAMYQYEDSSATGAKGLGISAFQFPNAVTTGGVLLCDGAPCNLGVVSALGGGAPFITQNFGETDAWGVKPFWRKAWSPIGATVLFGEYGQYNDQFAAARNLCLDGFGAGTAVGAFCAAGPVGISGLHEGVFVTGSEVERWGLGVVQEIDSAAMHLWARWQHQEVDVGLVGVEVTNPGCELVDPALCNFSSQRINQGFDDFDIFQVGGVIFF